MSQLIPEGIGASGDIAHYIRGGLSGSAAPPASNSYIITQGIGTPSSISHMMLGGLSPNPGGGGGGSGVMRRIGYGGGLVSV